MTKWKHAVAEGTWPEVMKDLQDRDGSGWELVSTLRSNDGGKAFYRFFWKMEIEEPSA